MKKLISAVLALSLLGATAASAQTYRGRDSYSQSYRHSGHNDGAAWVGLGIGLFALAAIAASQHHDRDAYAYDRRYDERNRYDRSYGYPSYGYDRSYDGRYGYSPYGYGR